MPFELIIWLSSVILTAAAVRLIRPFALHIGLVDIPAGRKTHSGNIPLIGGIAIYIAFSLSVLLFHADLNTIRGFILAGSLLITIGVLDDHHEISVKVRFLFQILAGIIMTSMAGVVLYDLGLLLGTDTPVTLAIWAAPFSVIAVIGVINALNMVDGIDGLAGSLALVTLIAIQLLALMNGTVHIEALIISGTIIGFLWFNLFSRDKIFLGDAGSMFLGFALAWFLIEATQGEQRLIPPVVALWLFAVPLIDTVAIMIRRLLKGQSPFLPDREHLHHLFLRAGFTPPQTLLIISAIAILLATFGSSAYYYGLPEWLLLITFLALFGLYLLTITHAWVVLKTIRRLLHRSNPRPDNSSTPARRHD